MAKIRWLIDRLVIIVGVLFLIEGCFSFVAGARIPFLEFAIQCLLATLLIRLGIARINDD